MQVRLQKWSSTAVGHNARKCLGRADDDTIQSVYRPAVSWLSFVNEPSISLKGNALDFQYVVRAAN